MVVPTYASATYSASPCTRIKPPINQPSGAGASLSPPMALEELPHNTGRVDFSLRPGVPKAIDADHADLGSGGAPFVAHRRQRTWRVFEDRVALAASVCRPPRESIGHSFQPLGAAALGVSVVRVLRIGEPVKCEHWNRTAAAWTRK